MPKCTLYNFLISYEKMPGLSWAFFLLRNALFVIRFLYFDYHGYYHPPSFRFDSNLTGLQSKLHFEGTRLIAFNLIFPQYQLNLYHNRDNHRSAFCFIKEKFAHIITNLLLDYSPINTTATFTSVNMF